MSIRLIVGLGNPGSKYAETRHNIGFQLLDLLAKRDGLSWYRKSRYPAEIADWQVNGGKIFLLKPETFMNLSGSAVAPFAKDREISRGEILVVHDELDLPLGKMKLAYDRGPAGHNGVQSIIDHLGGKDFHRLRLGIARVERSTSGADYVLGKFTPDEKKQVDECLEAGVGALELKIKEP